jgi:AraC-like DNA-binding protein
MYSCFDVHPQTYKNLAHARDFMRDAYQRPINLPEISAQANLSPYYFQRVYRRTFQETPHEFLTRLRLERAKTLLARGSHNVTEACFEVGFSSLGSFSTLFTHRVGMSPSEYRRYVRSGIAVPRTVRPLFIPTCYFTMLCGATETG